ncbi:MAG: MBL fold metallo-hydrolase [Planctomycetota bacterium]|nr:MBL fold metallo-hydrolase [Planctomycetota bacterium]
MPALTRLAENLYVHHGAVNTGIVKDGPRALLLDGGGAELESALRELGVERVEAAAFTHHHREQTLSAYALAARGARLYVPKAERGLFEAVEDFWREDRYFWRTYKDMPLTRALPRNVPVARALAAGESFEFGPARIAVLATPGHTRGHLSYRVEVPGAGPFVFCGDTLCGIGQVPDLFSLQYKEPVVKSDYHGFMGARGELVASLRRLKEQRAAALIPSRGGVLREAAAALDATVANLEAAYLNYQSISALRWYYPEAFAAYAGCPQNMPLSAQFPYPDWLKHYNTCWVLVSESGAALVMDITNKNVHEQLESEHAKGVFGAMEVVWLTHYHADHTDGIVPFQARHPCVPLWTDARVADVVERPRAWKLPCVDLHPLKVSRRTEHGESWTWREFKLTAYHLPGQTWNHGGLLAEGRGKRLFFGGDSFTPSGLDDYCAQNRNLLGRGRGYDACLALLEELKPDLVFNCHVDVGFTFNARELAYMRAQLARRETLFAALTPWPHPDFATDENWIRVDPWEQDARAGQALRAKAVVWNHATRAIRVELRPAGPDGRAYGETAALDIPARGAGEAELKFLVPADARPGRNAVPFEVALDGKPLGAIVEALAVVRA